MRIGNYFLCVSKKLPSIFFGFFLLFLSKQFFFLFEPIHGFRFFESEENTKGGIENQCSVVVTMNNVLKGQRFGVLDGCPDILLLFLDTFQECLFMAF